MRYSCLQLVQAYAYIGSTRVYWMRLDDDDNNDDDNNDDDDGNENKWVLIIHSEAASVLHSLWTAHRIIRRRAELYWARYAKRASVDISNGNAMSASDIVGSQMRGEVIWARLHVCVCSPWVFRSVVRIFGSVFLKKYGFYFGIQVNVDWYRRCVK